MSENSSPRYIDSKENVYTVEKAVRNQMWIVVRTNVGGNRKGVKDFQATRNRSALEEQLRAHAEQNGWGRMA